MTDDDKRKKMFDLAMSACETDTGRRLVHVCLANNLIRDIIETASSDVDVEVMTEFTNREAAFEVASREYEGLADDEQQEQLRAVIDHIRWHVVGATRQSWTVATALGLDPEEISPDAIAWLAAVSITS